MYQIQSSYRLQIMLSNVPDSHLHPDCNTESGFKGQLYIELGS